MTTHPLRIELLLAYPKTRKCQAIKDLAEEALGHFPNLVRIDEYEAGTTCPMTPTEGFRTARSGKGKFKKIPSVFVNGVEISVGEIPDRETFFRTIEAELKKDRAL